MIQCIVSPKIDFKGLLSTAKKILGRNLNVNVDSNKTIVPESSLSLLCEFLELSEKDGDIDLIGEYNILDSLSYGFLTGLESEDIILIRCYTQLSIVCSEENVRNVKLSVITGNLLEWKLAVIYFATQSQSYVLRTLAAHLYNYFEINEHKLASIMWSKYRPIFNTRGELLLQLK